MGRSALTLGAALACLACTPVALAGPGCAPVGGAVTLPAVLAETSGVAIGSRDPAILWTHTDDGTGLWAIDGSGAAIAGMPVAAPLADWEDLEIAPCGPGPACLYLADTGDNAERRAPGNVTIVRVREPVPVIGQEIPAEVFPVRYPDGPRDVEALFVLPGERVHVVTKGRRHAVTVYRYPGPLRPDTVTLEEVQRLSAGAEPLLAQVTGASSAPDGSVVAIRTYQSLQFYDVDGDTLVARRDGLVDLRSLEEVQGEGVALGEEGRVVLTSEGGPLGGPASMRTLRCALGG